MTTLSLQFLSDWHIGEGAGAQGYIDRVLRRDPHDGLPYVPAKSLTGLLRDGCERVALALDEGRDDGPWSRFVAELFGRDSRSPLTAGTTSPALVRLTPARLPKVLRKALAAPDYAPLRQGLILLKPGVRLDANGTAAHDMYRIEEMAVGGCTLEAEITLDERLDPTAVAAAQALLAAGAAAVERIGGKRRRGHGRCQLKMADWRIDPDLLRAAPPKLSLPEPSDHALMLDASSAAVTAYRRHKLRLIILEPLQIPEQTLGNFVGCRDHVPGTLLLAALDPLLRQALGQRAERLTSWLAAGVIRVGFAYPEVGQGRGLPVPLCLEQGKQDKNDLRNRLQPDEEDAVQRKPLRTGYVTAAGVPSIADDIPQPFMPPRISLTHAVIEDASQRPTEAVGGVFTYEALAAGLHLRTEIMIDEACTGAIDLRLLDGVELRLGRAKKDDYGRVRLVYLGDEEVRPPASDDDQRLVLWLTSPAIVRDACLEPVTDAEGLTRMLEQQLAVPGLICERAFYRLVRDDGWQTSWNDARPTRTALAAGSVFVFRAAWTDEVRARLQAGIGERRGEGYGEVCLDPPLLSTGRPPVLPHGKQGAAHDLPPVPEDEFTRLLHWRAWRRLLVRALTQGFEDLRGHLGWTNGQPNNAQLGAVRALMLDFDRDRFKRWLDALEGNERRRAKWPQQSLKALRTSAEQPEHLWQTAGLAERLPVLPGQDRTALMQTFARDAVRQYWLTLIGLEFDRREKEAAAERAVEGSA
ncbi:MAG: RAMP superfamily CRISPR-associated protein [Thiobacillaceae bacterium]|nr:RAMP superfamily CRISPR-associated protein [Thiobacillaceae bacterium]